MDVDTIRMIANQRIGLPGSGADYFETTTFDMDKVDTIDGTGYSVYRVITSDPRNGPKVRKLDFFASGPNGAAQVVDVEWAAWQDCPAA